MHGNLQRSLGALGALITLTGLSTAVWAQSAEDFYRGKRELTIIVGSQVGGGYDQYGRMLGRHMTKYIPGNPTVIVQNMVGGGGIRAANYLYNVSAKDGTAFGILDRGMPTAPLLYGDKSQARFDALKFSWIGSTMHETGMGVLSARSPVKTIEDAKTREAFFGTTGPETDPAMFARLVNELVGTKIKSIHGYKGQPEEFQSVEKGELDGLFMSGWSGPGRAYVRDKIGRGEMRLLVQMAPKPDPLHADTPTILQLVRAPEDQAIVRLILDRMTLGRPFVGPPGIPPDRLAILRMAFRKALEDPELRNEATKLKLALDPTWGAEAREMIEGLYATPQPIIERARRIVAFTAEQ